MRQPLKDLAAICAGQGAPQGDHNYCENGTPFVKAGNLQELLEGKAITSIQKVSDEVAKKHKLRLYPKGTILFAKSGMSCMKGYIYVLPQSAYVVSHLACITPNEDISEYLRYYFNYHKPNQLVKDAAYPSISLSDVGNLVVDMKPESERNEIVSVLQHTESIITLRQQQLQKLNELVKARFVELFGDLANPSCLWETIKLADACASADDIKCGPFGTQLGKGEYVDSGVAVWEIPQINAAFKACPTHFITEEKATQLKAYSLVPGDIAMSRKGNVGRCAIFPDEYVDGIIHSDVLRIRVNEQKVNPVFMMYQLHFSSAVINQIEMVSSGAIMAGVNVTKLKQIYVHIPPKKLQDQFVSFVKQTDKSKVAVQKALDEAQLLFDSLMQKYFG